MIYDRTIVFHRLPRSHGIFMFVCHQEDTINLVILVGYLVLIVLVNDAVSYLSFLSMMYFMYGSRQ